MEGHQSHRHDAPLGCPSQALVGKGTDALPPGRHQQEAGTMHAIDLSHEAAIAIVTSGKHRPPVREPVDLSAILNAAPDARPSSPGKSARACCSQRRRSKDGS